ncbi:MAG: winged helix DNA-binding protein [Microscillaceae bacterium]|nr:winged helix DNA-binding protein [Microscillaceae bacterium]MDW8461313.1 winged helix DNA-binding protein [Cytophagales bacterium]
MVTVLDSQIVDLVNAYYQYAQEHVCTSVENFCQYYIAKEKMKKIDKPKETTLAILADTIESRLGMLFGRLSRFINLELKQLVEKVQIDTTEEMWYLIMIWELKQPTKSDVIHDIIAEYSSGIAVINRLLAKGYVQEFPDEQDKRAKRLKITPQGEKKVWACFQHLSVMAQEVFANLSQDEKEILHQILYKLEQHHTQRYEKSR